MLNWGYRFLVGVTHTLMFVSIVCLLDTSQVLWKNITGMLLEEPTTVYNISQFPQIKDCVENFFLQLQLSEKGAFKLL